MWGKLYRRKVLLQAAVTLNILIANKIILYEDELIMSAILSSSPALIGLNSLGYSYFMNQESVLY
jgi:hypothetical protein